MFETKKTSNKNTGRGKTIMAMQVQECLMGGCQISEYLQIFPALGVLLFVNSHDSVFLLVKNKSLLSIICKNLLFKHPGRAFLSFASLHKGEKQQSCQRLFSQKPVTTKHGIENANDVYAFKR